jgi:hypothetical protein
LLNSCWDTIQDKVNYLVSFRKRLFPAAGLKAQGQGGQGKNYFSLVSQMPYTLRLTPSSEKILFG